MKRIKKNPETRSDQKWTLIPKTIGNRKKDCAWLCARGINTTWENLQIEKHISVDVRWAERTPSWFVLCDLEIFSVPHAQSLLLFPIVFGINLIHFFDEKKDGATGNSIVCLAASIPSHAIWQCEFYEEWELFRRVQRFWQRNVWTHRHSKGKKLTCKFLARKSSKLIANFSAKMMTSLPSFSLCISLSLSPSAPHAQYRKRFCASYNTRSYAVRPKCRKVKARKSTVFTDRARGRLLEAKSNRYACT